MGFCCKFFCNYMLPNVLISQWKWEMVNDIMIHFKVAYSKVCIVSFTDRIHTSHKKAVIHANKIGSYFSNVLQLPIFFQETQLIPAQTQGWPQSYPCLRFEGLRAFLFQSWISGLFSTKQPYSFMHWLFSSVPLPLETPLSKSIFCTVTPELRILSHATYSH